MSRRIVVTVGLLVAASVVNVASFVAAPSGIRPLRVHDSPHLRDLVVAEQRSLRLGGEAYLALAEHAAGMVVSAPPGVLDQTHANGLADLSLVVTDAPRSVTDEQAASLAASAVDSGELRLPDESEPRPYHILAVDPDAARLEVVVTARDVLFVDELTLAEAIGG